MLKITYEYDCDVCKSQIREPEKYTLMPNVRAVNTAIPLPSYEYSVGEWFVCRSCYSTVLDALTKRCKK